MRNVLWWHMKANAMMPVAERMSGCANSYASAGRGLQKRKIKSENKEHGALIEKPLDWCFSGKFQQHLRAICCSCCRSRQKTRKLKQTTQLACSASNFSVFLLRFLIFFFASVQIRKLSTFLFAHNEDFVLFICKVR